MALTGSRFDQLVEENKVIAQSWKTPLTMQEMREYGDELLYIVTCMDPRASTDQIFGRNAVYGTFRNAGGRYSPDIVRSINILRSLLTKATKQSVIVIHHTDCGMTHTTNQEAAEDAKKRYPVSAALVDKIDFGAFAAEDIDKSVIEDCEKLKKDPLLEGMDVFGYVLSTEEGTVRRVY